MHPSKDPQFPILMTLYTVVIQLGLPWVPSSLSSSLCPELVAWINRNRSSVNNFYSTIIPIIIIWTFTVTLSDSQFFLLLSLPPLMVRRPITSIRIIALLQMNFWINALDSPWWTIEQSLWNRCLTIIDCLTKPTTDSIIIDWQHQNHMRMEICPMTELQWEFFLLFPFHSVFTGRCHSQNCKSSSLSLSLS